MRIDDGHHLSSIASNLTNHLLGVGKGLVIPSEIALAIRVLNVEPYYIVGDVVLLEFTVDVADIILVLVVPATLTRERGSMVKTYLVIGNRKERRKFLPSYQGGELSKNVFWSGSYKEENIWNV